MCKIVWSRSAYKKESGYTEVVVPGGSSYDIVARKAATTLDLQAEDGDGDLSLFCCDGRTIPRTTADVWPGQDSIQTEVWSWLQVTSKIPDDIIELSAASDLVVSAQQSPVVISRQRSSRQRPSCQLHSVYSVSS